MRRIMLKELQGLPRGSLFCRIDSTNGEPRGGLFIWSAHYGGELFGYAISLTPNGYHGGDWTTDACIFTGFPSRFYYREDLYATDGNEQYYLFGKQEVEHLIQTLKESAEVST